MNPSADQLTRKIVPFGPSAGDKQSDELDRSGEAIISLLQQAADAARANEDRAASTTLAFLASRRGVSHSAASPGWRACKRSRMACLMAGMLGCGGGPPILFFPPRCFEAARLKEGVCDHDHQGVSV